MYQEGPEIETERQRGRASERERERKRERERERERARVSERERARAREKERKIKTPENLHTQSLDGLWCGEGLRIRRERGRERQQVTKSCTTLAARNLLSLSLSLAAARVFCESDGLSTPEGSKHPRLTCFKFNLRMLKYTW